MKYVIRAVEERKPFVEEILKQIPEAIVYYDEYHDAMKSYLHVCREIIKDEPAVLLEDDIILTSDFKNKIEAIIGLYPDVLINFFSLSKKHTTPYWRYGKEYVMNQCEYFPKGFASKVVNTYEEWKRSDGGKNPTAYDYLVGYTWGAYNKYLVWNPSLVQHREVKSIINPKRSTKRQSITFVD